jgi:hypothetical protein
VELEFTYPVIELPSSSLLSSSLSSNNNKKGKNIDKNQATLKKLEDSFVESSAISKKK